MTSSSGSSGRQLSTEEKELASDRFDDICRDLKEFTCPSEEQITLVTARHLTGNKTVDDEILACVQDVRVLMSGPRNKRDIQPPQPPEM